MTTVLVGTVISGTLRTQDLLPAFLEELERVDPELYRSANYGYRSIPMYALEDVEWWETEAASEALGQVIDALNDAAPEGYYFGAHWGDGADFGYWPIDDE